MKDQRLTRYLVPHPHQEMGSIVSREDKWAFCPWSWSLVLQVKGARLLSRIPGVGRALILKLLWERKFQLLRVAIKVGLTHFLPAEKLCREG